jgi:ribonuclease BN (tRNA processing enzyme)
MLRTNKYIFFILLIFFLILFDHIPVNSLSAPGHKSVTRIVLLGTGTPVADPDRSGPSVAIVVDSTPYIIDFGPGIVHRADSDHTAGYPDLIFTPWTLGRKEPLEVYGPKGIKSMTEHILAAYRQDIKIRSERHKNLVNVHEIKPGIVYKDSLVRVEAFPVSHGSWPIAFAYKFYTPDRTIVVSGDTAYDETVIEKSMGVDVLIHEVYNMKGFEKIRSPKTKSYHSGFHTSSHELAKIANKAKPGLLILYHQLWMNQPESDLLKEVRERYDGRVVSGKDLDIY